MLVPGWTGGYLLSSVSRGSYLRKIVRSSIGYFLVGVKLWTISPGMVYTFTRPWCLASGTTVEGGIYAAWRNQGPLEERGFTLDSVIVPQ